MKPMLWAVLLALGCACSKPKELLATQPTEPQAEPQAEQQSEPPRAALEATETRAAEGLSPLARIAGFSLLQGSSKLLYESAPEAPQRYRFLYVFPDRARGELSPFEGEQMGVAFEYRYGQRLFIQEYGSKISVELEGLDRQNVLRRFELRKALLLYPDGLTWSEGRLCDGSAGRLAMVAEVHSGAALGTLETSLDEQELPRWMAFVEGDLETRESLSVLEWQNLGTRRFPKRMELRLGADLIWTEEVLELRTVGSFYDSAFLPADRDQGTPLDQELKIASTQLPELWIERVALEPTARATWALAEAAAHEALARSAARLAANPELAALYAVDKRPGFGLDANNLPSEVWVRWRLQSGAAVPGELPLPVERLAPQAAFYCTYPALDQIRPADLLALRAARPPESGPGQAFVLIAGPPTQPVVQVLLR